jgi:hypothetical protein
MDDKNIKKIPINDLRQEEGASELATSPDMQPYLQYIMATMKGGDGKAELEMISKLPLEKRYVWRIVSAMKWAFADLEDMSIQADRDTLNKADMAKVTDLLKIRPIQFCIFLKTLVGAEEMKMMMLKAISVAGRQS